MKGKRLFSKWWRWTKIIWSLYRWIWKE